ncbi:2'-5' RNA ligase [Sphaerisporangium album]|uniref:2'-5' RNA ligase n=1 Tax=Sphaerisporangium album TaxID=509200 RepID=A0A367FA33_9ACTN|nr:RNA ligase [Sphaerisporangium album]RCG27214.1 2'-5' RNA ligase [Sphaerisporangium album]
MTPTFDPRLDHLHIWDLVKLSSLEDAVEQGLVREQRHPAEALRIFNYTEKTIYEQAWTSVTQQCRGLVVDDHGAVIARPYEKFFNHGEPLADELNLSAPAQVLDKLDGSLGILVPTSTGYEVATRGSFTSEQALHATALYRARYAAAFTPPPGVTVLFEIVYPANRIVCDYGGADDLFLLGGVEIRSGRVLGPDEIPGWPGPAATVFNLPTLADALAMPPRPGAEGLVVRQLDTGHMVKIKQEDYVRLHAIVTRTSARNVWEFCAVDACKHLITVPKHWGSRIGLDPERATAILAMGPDWEHHLIEGVPDEFHTWIRTTISRLRAQATDLHKQLTATARELEALYGDDRKAFAADALQRDHFGELFLLRDRRDITTNVWKLIYPPAEKPWGARSEAVA